VSEAQGHDGAAAWPVTLADGTRFDAPASLDLVSAARASGWRLASSCRNGSCRTCRCVLLAGRIEHRIAWPGLSREELAEGWILPCVALPRSALRLQTAAEPLGASDRGGSVA
jgi:ferredoxin